MKNQAVISGVNDYRYAPYDRLRGCAEDSQGNNLLAQNHLKFRPDGINLFIDSMAEAGRIKAKVWEIVVTSRGGNHLLWTHSSHGTNQVDPTQADGMQELLCCYDTREKNGQWDMDTVISAKFVGEIVAQVHPDDRMDIIFDCCYAPEGSQLKAMGLSYARTRFMPLREVNMIPRMVQIDPKPKGLPSNVCLWSACESDQTSADAYIDGKWQGAFSAAFRKFFKVGRSRSDIIYYARKWLKDNQYEQVPHLYGVDLAGKSL
jgi:hypothetical protein